MNRICDKCGSSFTITEGDLAFYDKISPSISGQTLAIPAPQACPDCRQQRRLTWRNERCLYSDSCDLCGKKMISLYSPQKPYPVYCQECWWSDRWNPLAYGTDYDLGRSFFEQFHELQLRTPRIALFNLNSINSEYTNHSSDNKNCYMGVAFGSCQDCLYGHWIMHSNNTVDGLYLEECNSCYNCAYCLRCYSSYHCEFSQALSDCMLCFECRHCDNCIGCVHLQHKNYYVLNKPVSKSEFASIKAECLVSRESLDKLRREFAVLKLAAPRRYSYQINCLNSTGNDLYNCKNAQHCFNCRLLQDSKYMYDLGNCVTSMDCYEHGWLVKSELVYECHAGMAGYRLLFCNMCAYSQNLLYCDLCFNNCADLFGCTGLKHLQHCILNKQYTKEDYEKLVLYIIQTMRQRGEWGQFFPPQHSTFAYNESPAGEYFPLTRKDICSAGFLYSDYEQPKPALKKTVAARELDADIQRISDDILDWALICEISGKPFRIIAPELSFYRKQGLPIPTRHPDIRHSHRAVLRNPRKLFSRNCECCKASIYSCYPPDFKERVYCEKCYLEAVF